jgi:hypothetical protein
MKNLLHAVCVMYGLVGPSGSSLAHQVCKVNEGKIFPVLD